jgi:hypothetical protein
MPSASLPLHELRSGLSLLIEALDWASLSGIDPWDFAVEVSRLRAAGLSDTHLRWLVVHNYLQHAFELTLTGDEKRSYRHLKTLRFRQRSCFILSPDGAEFARPLCAKRPDIEAASATPDATRPRQETAAKPHWDPGLRQLTIGEEVVKRFQRPARVQEMILAAFEEEGWPPRIDDPLPRMAGQDPKRRLRGVIEALNQNQLVRIVHFLGDGTGERVCWTLVPS